MKQTMQLTASSSALCHGTTDGEMGHRVILLEQAALRRAVERISQLLLKDSILQAGKLVRQKQYRRLVSTSCLPRKPRMFHRYIGVLHQDHQRRYGPPSHKLWSGTGTEDVNRYL